MLGPRLAHPAVLELLKKYPAPADLKTAGKTKVHNLLKKKAPRLAQKLTEEVFHALEEQKVTVAGTSSATQIIASLASQLELILVQRAEAKGLESMRPLLASTPKIISRTIEGDDWDEMGELKIS